MALRSAPAIEIDENRRLLNRYRFVLHEAMHVFAGWLPRVAWFELKCEFGRAVWENSLHVNTLYLRLREIQSPAFQRPADRAFRSVMEELLHAPDELALALGYHRVIIPGLVAALANHEKATFPNSDLPSVRAIQHILFDLRAQQRRLGSILRQAAKPGPDAGAAEAWVDYLARLLAAAGGVAGTLRRGPVPAAPARRTRFRAPTEAARDARFTNLHADPAPMPAEDDARHTIEEFERYSTEMLAAETVAVVLFAFPDMPWEFQLDSARHLYDEIRHALMGCEWMRRHGMDPFASPQYVHVFKWRCQFPPVMQYCMLTMGNEVHAFPYRHRRVEAHHRRGDRLSEQFVRYDVADETQHVRFGHRWLPELLKHVGEKRPSAQYTADVLEVWEREYRTGKLTINVE